MTMPSARWSFATAIGRQDRVRDGRCRRDPVGGVDPDVDGVRGQDFEGGPKGRLGQRVGVLPDEEGAVVALLSAVAADRLGDGQDVRLVEGPVERRAAVSGGAERDALAGHVRIGPQVVVGGDEPFDVDEL